MEPLAAASQLGAGRESGSSSSSSASSSSSSSPHSKQELQPYAGSSPLKPNQVGETSLYGVPIVSLVIDGQERLCLAQISNTLLKNFSYNEIHNRRVALGITCVQCTPVQLEILRRAGAMPISSRRCGMITKREAERLCKSFLGEHKPPKLPENFAFDVVHECAWGSRGSFIPARYNSSRAKCIKCSYCSMYFSPNKFIFHSHRTPDAKYTQPDAANFNSWRRHLKLTDKSPQDELVFAWEDVKAMFNGGSRKRALPSSAAPSNHARPPQPPPPCHPLASVRTGGVGLAGGGGSFCSIPKPLLGTGMTGRNYPVIPVPSKGFGMLQKLPPPLFPPPYGFPAAAFGLCPKKQEDSLGGPGGDPSKGSYLSAFRPVVKDAESIAKLYGTREVYGGPRGCPGYLSPDFLSEGSSSYRSLSPGNETAGEPDVDVESNRFAEDEDEEDEAPGGDVQHSPPPPQLLLPEADESLAAAPGGGLATAEKAAEAEESPSERTSSRAGYELRVIGTQSVAIPASVHKTISFECLFPSNFPLFAFEQGKLGVSSVELESLNPDFTLERIEIRLLGLAYPPGRDECPQALKAGGPPITPYHCAPDKNDPEHEDNHSAAEDLESKKTSPKQRSVSQPSPTHAERGEEMTILDVTGTPLGEKDLGALARDELQRLLLEQMDLRKKLEREFQSLKDNFQDQMKRELAYREEMVQQLQIVRDTLCNELDQERKARYAIQQKLKEAHDALHHFSCKMLTPRHCAGNCSFKPPLLPQ
ncbi:PREDICTED: SKI family transcriptional corepressor 1 [Thamnophis sirtalis]|uniref:SKI family transcriptional corepressor 1 n=1 Tax=Thamnophis sirtalis TaxID=35019 RepID=A0A6I9XB08_9SAUR|nr:PREDICTED: SKI family transcriptional corepressor 1 [Thamnophis sirtalis]